jgi:hypothetical protein
MISGSPFSNLVANHGQRLVNLVSYHRVSVSLIWWAVANHKFGGSPIRWLIMVSVLPILVSNHQISGSPNWWLIIESVALQSGG